MAKVQVLIIQWIKLPQDMQDLISKHPSFGNDRMLEYISDMSPCGDEKTWSNSLSMKNIEEWRQDQVDENNYVGDLDSFIEDSGLKFCVWLLNSGLDLNVSRILIDVCW